MVCGKPSFAIFTRLAAALLLAMAVGEAQADEGMWTFDNFPIAGVNKEYGTHIDQAWLDRIRLAACLDEGEVHSPRRLACRRHCGALFEFSNRETRCRARDAVGFAMQAFLVDQRLLHQLDLLGWSTGPRWLSCRTRLRRR